MLPLLRTKTTIPPARPRQIERPQLQARLEDGVRRALTTIVAPAGYGKTTLVTAWAASAGLPVGWLSLQPGDRSRKRFLTYVIQALRSIAPEVGATTLALLQAGPLEGALAALVNDLSAVERDLALVLDDFHTVDNPEIGRCLQFLLENRPAQFHLVIISRTTPMLDLTRLRALGQLVEVQVPELLFSKDEAGAFLETTMGLHLTAAEHEQLHRSTEGWAAGLQLAALARAHQPNDRQAPAGRAHVFDYLAQEVLRQQTPDIQVFLKSTALFDRFCVALLEHVWSETASSPGRTGADLLAEVARTQLFIVPLEGEGVWYRYHALFGDFLRRLVPAPQAGGLYAAASDWFERQGLFDDAIHYAVHAADFERAADLLESHYRDLIQHGAKAGLSEWLNELPTALLDRRPRLWLARGWASLIALDSEAAAAHIARAEAAIPAGLADEELRSEAKSLRILSAIFAGQVAAADEISSAFIALSEKDDFLHSLLHFNLGLHHVLSGETDQAVENFSETLRLSRRFHNPLMMIVAQVQLGETRQRRGALKMAEHTFLEAMHYARDTLGDQTFLLGMPYIAYADLLREQNRDEDAVTYAEQGIRLCQAWQPVAGLDGHITLARLRAAQGDWGRAENHLASAQQLTTASASILDDTLVALHMARLALLRNESARAAEIIQRHGLHTVGAGAYHHVREFAALVLLRADVSDRAKATAAIAALETLRAEAERRGRVTSVIEARLLLAYAHSATGHRGEVVAQLSHALTLGAQGGYVRLLADEGAPLRRLLEAYGDQIRAPRQYVDQIGRLLNAEAARPAATAAPDDLPPLTQRELDILCLVAAGLSNQEIAAQRVVALNTVKKHVSNILAKLGVTNRTQAVARARQHGWIR